MTYFCVCSRCLSGGWRALGRHARGGMVHCPPARMSAACRPTCSAGAIPRPPSLSIRTSMILRRPVTPRYGMAWERPGLGRCRDRWPAMIHRCPLSGIAAGGAPELRLGGRGTTVPPASCRKFGGGWPRSRPAISAVKAHTVRRAAAQYRLAIHVVNDVSIHVVDDAVVVKRSMIPIPASVSDAGIAETVVDAAVKSDLRTPIAFMPQVRAAAPAPIPRSPSSPGPLENLLAERGWLPRPGPAFVMTAAIADIPVRTDTDVQLDTEPDASWLALYRYRGQDLPPIARTLLMSAPWQAFATVRRDGRAVACGRISVAGAPGEQWGAITAVEVDPAWQRQGLGAALTSALAAAAAGRAARRVLLQVETGNAPARALYFRCGFRDSHRYHYMIAPPAS